MTAGRRDVRWKRGRQNSKMVDEMDAFKFLYYIFLDHELEVYERTNPDAELHGWWKVADIVLTAITLVTNISIIVLVVTAFCKVHKGDIVMARELFFISLAGIFAVHVIDFIHVNIRSVGDSRKKS